MTSAHRPAASRKYRSINVVVKDYTTCYICGLHPFPEKDVFCSSCGFPQRGSDDDKNRFVLRRRQLRSQLRDAESDVARGRWILMIIACGYLFVSLINLAFNDSLYGLFYFLIGGSLLGLWFYSKIKPIESMLMALLLYVVLNVISLLVSPMLAIIGLLLKIIAFAALLFAWQSARKAMEIRAQIDPRIANDLTND